MGVQAGGREGEDMETCDNDSGELKLATTRIFIGGLGGTVTAEDLCKTFSALGKVESVEIVRTKCRSFAYFDFLPSSENSLSKLFSRYNGCMWKGGRMRLEKAREHYLLRLKQEWAEDAKLNANSPPCNSSDATKNMDSPKKHHHDALDQKKMEIQIFFPKLRKVKSLPLRGTGKHKYSFQHVQARPLPLHFCDCEEHSDSSHIAKANDLSNIKAQDGGVDEKELNMMMSVMNKLFEKENNIMGSGSEDGLVKKEANIIKSVDGQLVGGKESDLPVDDSETDHMTDEDNLVINIVAKGKNRKALLMGQGRETINEGTVVDGIKSFKDRPSRNMHNSQREKKTILSGKKRKSPPIEETAGNEVSANPDKKGSAKKLHLREPLHGTELKLGSKQSNADVSWSQKSAWRDLAGEQGKASFSISHIMQSTTTSFTKEESSSDGHIGPRVAVDKTQNMEKSIDLEPQPDSSEGPKVLTEIEPREVNDINKSARGAAWLQKSSWNQLVNSENSSFSISQLLPRTTVEKLVQAKSKNMDASNSTYGESLNFVKTGSSRTSGEVCRTRGGDNKTLTGPDASDRFASANSLNPEVSSPLKKLQASGENSKTSPPKKEKLESVRSFAVSETCVFMRSDSSMRAWKNAKAALSGSLKKKKNSEK